MSKSFFLKTLLLVTTLYSCGPQTSKQDKVVEAATVSGTEPTSLEISEGAAKGVQANIPVGALAVGTTVDLTTAATPTDFKINSVESASSTIEIKATDANGNNVTKLNTPMTIAIPYSASEAGLYATTSKENLCAFLKSGVSLYVWRYSDLTVIAETKKVSLTTSYLGIFKLVYCGNDTLPGFTSIKDSQTSSTSNINASLSLNTKTYGYGSDHICAMVLGIPKSTNESKVMTVFAIQSLKNSGSIQTLKASFAPEKLQGIEKVTYLLLHQSAAQLCNLKIGDNLENSNIQLMRAYMFMFTPEEFKSGKAVGEFGVNRFALKSVSFAIGRPNTSTPDGNNAAQAFAKNICLEVKSDGNNSGFAAANVAIAADGTINGQTKFTLDIPSVNVTQINPNVQIGRSCSPNDKENANGLEPYYGRFYNAKFGDTLYLTPTRISADPVYHAASTNCLQINNPSATSSDNNITKATINLGIESYIYIPYSVPNFDISLTVGVGCNNTSGGTSKTFTGIAVNGELYLDN